MENLLATTETIAPGLGFALFGTYHLAWLAAFVLFALWGSLFYRKLTQPNRRIMRRVLATAIVADELLKMAVLFIGGNYTPDYLPLHLCSINIFLIAWHAVHPNKMLDNFLYIVCVPGAISALLTPNWASLPPDCLMHIHSFTVHILLASYPIILLAGKDIRPDPRQLPKCLALLGGLALVAVGANLLFDTNFMFFMEAPAGTPLVWFEQVCGSHLIGFPVIIAILLPVMYSPSLFRLLTKRSPVAK